MIKTVVTILTILAVSFAVLFGCGCQNEAQSGAAVGALAGAGVGQLAGRDTKSTLIGAGVGAGAGYIIGTEMEKQKTPNPQEPQEPQK